MTTLDTAPPPTDPAPAPVALLTPATLDEALRLLAADGTRPLGGGVGLTLRRHDRRPPDATAFVSLAALPGISGVTSREGHLTIGAGTTLDALAAHPGAARLWPVVTEAAGSVATDRIRRLVTLGGNVAARDETHDPPVALTAAGATATVRSAGGTRSLTIPELDRLRPDELIQDFRLPPPPPGTGSAYEKFLVRGVWEYACVHVAAAVTLDPAGRTRWLSVAVGSVEGGPAAIDPDGLLGTPANAALVEAVADRAAATTRPFDDVKGSAAYKTHMIAEFTRRALTTAVQRAGNRPPHRPGDPR
ncbi:FAD binding domain-containing protein [Streptomyces sp. NPDC050560]|uniref:FAD binding domain-containing protein n=1 Tax=Streptomyces sp. NPDC050560 TaxID=3365630 RepID=UPI0037BB8971